MIFSFSGNNLDTRRHVLSRDGAQVAVEPQVFDILHVLADNAGTLITKDALIEAVWDGRIVSDATISARINAARTAVGDNGTDQAIIRTVPRRGFQMVADVTRQEDAPTGPRARDQVVRYTGSADGASIAWSSAGAGPAVLYAWHHLSHLEKDWASPLLRPGLAALADRHRLIRFDIRGSGLSSPLGPEDTIDAHVADMLAVADAADVDRVPVIASLQAAAVAIRLAAMHPDRVSRLVLLNSYARGRALRENAPDEPRHDPFIALLDSGGWGDPENGFMRAWATMVLPMASVEETTELIRLIANAGSTKDALLQRNLIDRLDVTGDLGAVRAPTLVVHARMNAVHPVAEGRRVAAAIPDATFLEVDSSNTFFLPSEPAHGLIQRAIFDFLDEDQGLSPVQD